MRKIWEIELVFDALCLLLGILDELPDNKNLESLSHYFGMEVNLQSAVQSFSARIPGTRIVRIYHNAIRGVRYRTFKWDIPPSSTFGRFILPCHLLYIYTPKSPTSAFSIYAHKFSIISLRKRMWDRCMECRCLEIATCIQNVTIFLGYVI